MRHGGLTQHFEKLIYEKLRKRHSSGIPELIQESQKIQLADGTISKKVVGSVSIRIQASNTGVTKVDFFVMDSPNNLLGHLALEKLWPQQYNALKTVAEVPFPSKNIKKVPAVRDNKVPVVVSKVNGSNCCTKNNGRKQVYPGTRTSDAGVPALPERRYMKPLPKGEITKEMGEAYGKLICDTYPEVFDDEKCDFLNAEATILIEGHV